jgi:hypothetical protein
MTMRTNKAWLASAVALVALALVGACKEDEPVGGGTTGGVGGVGGASGGTGGVGGGGASGGVGGASGGTGGVGGASGGAGGASGGAGGTSGGAGGASGGMGGMTGGMGGASGGMGGMTGGMGGMTGGMGGGAPDAGGEQATFTEVYAIIEAKCGGGTFGCHTEDDGDFSGDLDMHDKATARTSLVGVAAMTNDCVGGMRVVAGDADNSFLIKAIEGTACIDRMPDGEDPLTADEIATFRSWVEGGALDN